MGLFYCSIAVVFFTAFYLLLGRSEKCGSSATGLNLAAFAFGAVLSAVAVLPIQTTRFPSKVMIAGAVIGIAAGLGLLAIILAIRSGMSVSAVNTVASLSLSVPIVFSLLFYNEVPTPRKWVGLAFAALSIILIQRERR